MTFPIQVGPSTITMNRDDRVLVCQPDATIAGLGDEGFFTRDTRFVSGYALWLNGRRPILLNSSPIRFFSSRYEFTNDDLLDGAGPIPRQTLSIRLDRTVSGGVHEDIDIVNYARRAVRLVVEVELQSDFADIFDVRAGTIVRRGTVNTRWFSSRARAPDDATPTATSGGSWWSRWSGPTRARSTPTDACCSWPRSRPRAPGTRARAGCRSRARGEADGRRCCRCNSVDVPVAEVGVNRLPAVGVESTNESVRRAWSQAVRDLESLRLEDPTFERGVVVPAAGVPWYVTVFGRDTLVVSMHAIGGYPEFAEGALRRLSALQATGDDPVRDMEPGKILHEIRHGELASTGVLPYTPYYGTHDATTLFLIVVSYLFHWLGDLDAVRRYLPNVDAALGWIDRSGDRDRDGFQEYATRSPHGYVNQGWKDAGDAVPHRDGSLAPPPIALVELQGYVYDAKLRMADLFDLVDRERDARRLRRQARGPVRPIQRAVLVGRRGHVLPGPRRLEAPDRDRRLQSRTPAAVGDRGARIRRAAGAAPARRRPVVRLGDPDAVRGPRRVQPVLVPHGVGLATRQRDHRGRAATVRVRRRGRAGREGHVRRGRAAVAPASARAVLGAAAPRGVVPGPVPRGQRAAGLGGVGDPAPRRRMCGIHARSDASGRRIYLDPALPDWLPSITLRDLRAGRGALSVAFDHGEVRVLDNTTGFEVVHGAPPRVVGRFARELNGPGA